MDGTCNLHSITKILQYFCYEVWSGGSFYTRNIISVKPLTMKTPQEKKKEYYQKNKERAKEYAKENAEHIARRMKIYRQEKREQLSEQNKEYRKRNIENIKEKVKLKYLQNKDEYLLKQRIRKQEPRTRE